MSSTLFGVERLLAPRHGPGVCPRCLNLTGRDGLCRACRENDRENGRQNQHPLAAVLPISYSVGGGWLHHLIAAYKRDADPWVPDAIASLAQILEEFVASHEPCLAAAAATTEFQLATTVPSADPLRDLHHPLRRIVGELVGPTRERYERLLVRSESSAIPRVFDPARYCPTRRLGGEAVLLIDDMWASGASAESAASALLAAGAGSVAAIIIGRHVNRGWDETDVRLSRLTRAPFDAGHCALCAEALRSSTRCG